MVNTPKISAKLAQAGTDERDLDTFLARFNIPYFFIDRTGKILSSNSSARDLIGDALLVSQGKLRPKAQSSQGDFNAALLSAFNVSLDAAWRWTLLRPDGGPPLLVQAFRAPRRTQSSLLGVGSDDVALITFTEIKTAVSGCPISVLQALQALGLTPAEARIAAALGAGATTAETAERYEITVGTLRIHLKSIFGKLDLRRQSDLTRLVTRLMIFG